MPAYSNNIIKDLIANVCEKGFADRSNFIRNVGAIGWALSCSAQLVAIAINPQIPKKEKKFLIPQELLDGCINVALFWCLTSKAKDFGRWLVTSGKILPKGIKEMEMAGFVEGMGLWTSIAGSAIATNIATPIVRNKIAAICQSFKSKNNAITPKDNLVTKFALPNTPRLNSNNSLSKPCNYPGNSVFKLLKV